MEISDLWMAPVVMDLDMLKIGCVLECWVIPVQTLNPLVDVRIVML
jgi:hypothetical protein